MGVEKISSRLRTLLIGSGGLSEPLFDENHRVRNWPNNILIEFIEIGGAIADSKDRDDLAACGDVLNRFDGKVPRGMIQMLARVLTDNLHTPVLGREYL